MYAAKVNQCDDREEAPRFVIMRTKDTRIFIVEKDARDWGGFFDFHRVKLVRAIVVLVSGRVVELE